MRSRPRCGECPVAAACIARRDGRQGELPASKPRAAVPERTSTFVLLHDGARLLLERRPPSGLWGGLLVPPEGEPAEVARRCRRSARSAALPAFRHAFTHFRLTLMPVLCRVVAKRVAEPGMEWVAIEQAADAGVPAPIRKLIRQVAALPG
jgi:A/G-specific adenine glycosylase